MHIVIAKMDEVLFEGEAKSLTVPGSAGEMTILSHHEPLITTLKPGRIVVRTDIEQEFPVTEGVLEINSAGATVIL
jgi:F-type H+-transporting ATPase subunit epsilon